MKVLTKAKSLSIGAMLAVSMAGSFATVSVVEAVTYFSCNAGYTYQTKSNAGRCFKAGRYMVSRFFEVKTVVKK